MNIKKSLFYPLSHRFPLNISVPILLHTRIYFPLTSAHLISIKVHKYITNLKLSHSTLRNKLYILCKKNTLESNNLTNVHRQWIWLLRYGWLSYNLLIKLLLQLSFICFLDLMIWTYRRSVIVQKRITFHIVCQ